MHSTSGCHKVQKGSPSHTAAPFQQTCTSMHACSGREAARAVMQRPTVPPVSELRAICHAPFQHASIDGRSQRDSECRIHCRLQACNAPIGCSVGMTLLA